MFDIGFWELIIIMIVALLVVGPERLPRLARTVGLWTGKAQHFIRTVKADIDKELATEELRRTLAKQAELPELQGLVDEVKGSVQLPGTPAPTQEPAAKAVPEQPAVPVNTSSTPADRPHDGTA